MFSTGMTARATFTVGTDDTALSVGSGDLDVLGTPRLLAWMEQMTCRAVADALDQRSTTVGTRMTIEHLGASAVGAVVEVTATVSHADGRLLRFQTAAHQDGKVIGTGDITRVVVDRQRFFDRMR